MDALAEHGEIDATPWVVHLTLHGAVGLIAAHHGAFHYPEYEGSHVGFIKDGSTAHKLGRAD